MDGSNDENFAPVAKLFFARSSSASLARLPHSADLRKGRFSIPFGMYFVTKCLKKGVGLSVRYRIEICDAFQHFRKSGDWKLHAFVVMPDHWHALFNLGERLSLPRLTNEIGRRASFRGRERNEPIFWQTEYFDHRVRPGESVVSIVRYIETNPVRKELSKAPSEWS